MDLELSYSLFVESVQGWMEEHAGAGWSGLRRDVLDLLQRERELDDLAALIGKDSLQDPERFLLDAAGLFREVVLVQNAFDPVDASSSLPRTFALARLAYAVYQEGSAALAAGRSLDSLRLSSLRSDLIELRQTPEDEWPGAATALEDRIGALAAERGR